MPESNTLRPSQKTSPGPETGGGLAAHRCALSMKDFQKLGSFIHSELGIKMPDAKRGMVESRLRKRLAALKMDSFTDYCNHLFSPATMQEELVEFINVITTNKTDFFREPKHFDYLENQALPDLLTGAGGLRLKNEVAVWSTACSRGHEPYTLAMVLSDFGRKQAGPPLSYSILATDISTRVLKIARNAVYNHEEITPVSMELRKRYLLKSKDRKKDLVRITPQLRSRVRFARLNLMDQHYPMVNQVDIIFCRNVMIYFEKKTQDEMLQRICRHLRPGGYLFMGHSEVLQCTNLPLEAVGTTIYKKQ